MRTRLRAILLLLLFGIVLNLMVAWTLAAWPRALVFDARLNARERTALWDRTDATGDSALERVRIDGSYSAPGSVLVIVRPDADRAGTVHIHRAGWPWPAFEGERRLEFADVGATMSFAVPLDLDLDLLAHTGQGGPGRVTPKKHAVLPAPMRVLPLKPLWRGLLFNMLAYGAMIALIVLLFNVTRGSYRRVRGRCPRCGYDLRGADHAACPECGRPGGNAKDRGEAIA